VNLIFLSGLPPRRENKGNLEVMMNQSESRCGVRIVCPACSQEGQRITCTSGNKSEIIFYHPNKIVHTICHVAGEGAVENNVEEIVTEARKHHETDTVETR